jgi:hypothetical protein
VYLFIDKAGKPNQELNIIEMNYFKVYVLKKIFLGFSLYIRGLIVSFVYTQIKFKQDAKHAIIV